jgi:hypothetical protein
MSASATDHLEVRWRRAGSNEAWSDPVKTATTSEIVIAGLNPTMVFEFEARAVSSCGAKSIWVPTDYTVPSAPALPPPNVPNATGTVDGIWMDWGDVDGSGTRGDLTYEIQRAKLLGSYPTVLSLEDAHPVGAFGDAYLVANNIYGWDGSAWEPIADADNPAWIAVARVRGSTWIDAVTDAASYVYRLRSVDFFGNVSTWTIISSPKSVLMSTPSLAAQVAAQFDAVDEHVTDLQSQVDGIVFDNFPEFAGGDGYAGDDAVYAGVFSQVSNRQEVDNVLQQTLNLIGAVQGDKRAFILDANTVKISADETLAQKLESVQVDFGPINARVDNEIAARASAVDALATNLNSVSVNVAGNTASVSTLASAQATTAGKVNASYTLRVDANNHISGFVFQNNGTQADFIVSADKFAVVSPTGSGARLEWSGGNQRTYDSAGTLRTRMGVW